ncbi:synaptojanin-2-binding protein [Strongylocentrotus purpuratus]|uniref:Synaptojanin-2-binding protein n=1 Tax=Strongylocentrotus purpuratus TaxID=7668 RepID=A0A7M7G3U1_STRPU|nr:synaptojanin-2-binding protein [Strongylocentrotus purpuratus]|eukprot:XP_001189397.2 PREDICTED: synaptojanin-2-binding protein [Strongylocentrotus purpuratus]
MELREERIDLQRGKAGLGFNIKGGEDQPLVAGDTGIFVTKIREEGAASKDGRLKRGDKILEINGEDVRAVPHKRAVDLFVGAGETVKLFVQHNAEALLRKKVEDAKARAANSRGGAGVQWMVVIGVVVTVGAFIWFRARRR